MTINVSVSCRFHPVQPRLLNASFHIPVARMPSGRQTSGSTSYSTSASTSYPPYSYQKYTNTTSRARTSRREGTAGRPRTGASTRIDSQRIICAVTESRGISPTVGLAFVNLDTGEAVMSQINDNQTYVRTIHKLMVYAPSDVLITATAAGPPSTLYNLISEHEENIGCKLGLLDRRYFAESTGLEYIHRLAFSGDVEAIKVSIGGNYFAVCCFAAVHSLLPILIRADVCRLCDTSSFPCAKRSQITR
jgi:DNA mismatch repair protein MSH4